MESKISDDVRQSIKKMFDDEYDHGASFKDIVEVLADGFVKGTIPTVEMLNDYMTVLGSPFDDDFFALSDEEQKNMMKDIADGHLEDYMDDPDRENVKPDAEEGEKKGDEPDDKEPDGDGDDAGKEEPAEGGADGGEDEDEDEEEKKAMDIFGLK
jgi:hypothetical protein